MSITLNWLGLIFHSQLREKLRFTQISKIFSKVRLCTLTDQDISDPWPPPWKYAPTVKFWMTVLLLCIILVVEKLRLTKISWTSGHLFQSTALHLCVGWWNARRHLSTDGLDPERRWIWSNQLSLNSEWIGIDLFNARKRFKRSSKLIDECHRLIDWLAVIAEM